MVPPRPTCSTDYRSWRKKDKGREARRQWPGYDGPHPRTGHFLETGSVRGRGAFPWEGPEAPQPLKRSGSQSFRSGSCEIQFQARCRLFPPLWGAENRHFGSLRPASLRRHMRSAAPFSPQFCTCAPTAERRCPLGSVHAGEQPHRSRSATVSRSERSAQATRPPLAALATDLIASSISRPSASKLSMINIVGREADAERPRGG